MTAKEIIGKNIQRHREALDIKQETLVFKLGISASALSQIETGKSDIIVSRIEQIANVLEKNFYEIVSSPNMVVSVHNSPNAFFNNTHSHSTDPKLLDTVVVLMHNMTNLMQQFVKK